MIERSVIEEIKEEIEKMDTLVSKYEVLDLIDKHIQETEEHRPQCNPCQRFF